MLTALYDPKSAVINDKGHDFVLTDRQVKLGELADAAGISTE